MKRACLDAGVVSLFLSKERTPEVNQLFDGFLKGRMQPFMLKHVLVEVHYHLCRDLGVSEANTQVMNVLSCYPLVLVDLDDALVLHAGKLKCQHSKALSYTDCMTIAFCLREHMELHSTEQFLKHVPNNTLQRLRVVRYRF